MHTSRRTDWRVFTLVMLLSLASACDKAGEQRAIHPPVAIEPGDECHVCGMLIRGFPGPKGEVFERDAETPLKFCSTRDLFAYLLQPDAAIAAREVYVHDMAATAWDPPEDRYLVDARKAWYVADQPLKGAMGPTLASFRNREDAQAFADKYHGRLLRFEDITLDLLNRLGSPGEGHGHPMNQPMPQSMQQSMQQH